MALYGWSASFPDAYDFVSGWMTCASIERIPYTMPGSDELAQLVSEALRSEWVVLMVNHGIVVAGTSLRRAADMVQIIERTADVILGCYQATGGKPPQVLPQKAVDLMRSYADFIA